MAGLEGMGNNREVEMVIFNSYMFWVNVVWFIHYCKKG